MNSQINVSNWSLALAFILVVISLVISYRQKLKLEKETIISVVRAICWIPIEVYFQCG